MEQGKWINLNAPEIQELICVNEYGDEYLGVEELDPHSVSFPVEINEGVLVL